MLSIVKRLAHGRIQYRHYRNERDAKNEYGVELTKLEDVHDADSVIVDVAHNEFKALSMDDIKTLYTTDIADDEKVIIDVKELYKIDELKSSGLQWWRL